MAGMQSRCRLPFPSSFKCEEHQSSPRSTTSLQERPSLSLTTNQAAQTNQSADRPSLIGVGILQLDCSDFRLIYQPQQIKLLASAGLSREEPYQSAHGL